MYPYNKQYIGSTNIPSGTFGNAPDLECPVPEGITTTPDNFYCGNIGDPQKHTLLTSNSFVQIYYSSFSKIKNLNEIGNGGAIYLSISDLSNVDESVSVKFYHSVFKCCYAKNGCAIYLESSDTNRLFDFYQCSFDNNKNLVYDAKESQAGGAIYIKSAASCFKFSDCLFSDNAALDGGAIYYLSEGQSSADMNNFALQFINCYFCQNGFFNAGGAIHISIKNNKLPRSIDINHCDFISNEDGDDDPIVDAPEFGGAIYYSYNSQEEGTSSGEFVYCLRVLDCIFIDNKCNSYGGSICMSVENKEPYKPIEISQCSFYGNHASTTFYYDEKKVFDGHGVQLVTF